MIAYAVSAHDKEICDPQTGIRVIYTNMLTILAIKKGGPPMKPDP